MTLNLNIIVHFLGSLRTLGGVASDVLNNLQFYISIGGEVSQCSVNIEHFKLTLCKITHVVICFK